MLTGFHYDGNEYFYIRSITGIIERIVDSNGNIVVEYKYDAWGKVISRIGEIEILNANNFLYKGYYYDLETQFYYCNARYYDPTVGRWISADDLLYLEPNNVGNLNLWSYCANNPMTRFDPSGNSWKSFWKVVAKVAAVVVIVAVIVVLTPISIPVATVLTVTAVVVANHIDNAKKIERAKQEVENMSNDDIDNYLDSLGITVKGTDIQTSEEKLVENKYDRIKALTAIKKRYEGTGSIYYMSAEWQGHNIVFPFTGNAANVDMNSEDKRWYFRVPTYILMLLGEI